MEQTKNYKLNKPGQDDFYNVEDFNQNADILDQALKELADGGSDQYVSKTGDTMSGELIVEGNGDYALSFGDNGNSEFNMIKSLSKDLKTTKDLRIYCDSLVFNSNTKVGNVAIPTHENDVATKKYVDNNAGGKRTCRFVVGTSTAGWTKKDCDYLCDGTNDQVEIQAAINALPSTGGEVVVLDGTYHITASINLNKNNVTLRGCGASTVLKRMWNYSNGISGVIVVNSNYCNVFGFFIDGNKSIYSDSGNYSIRINQNNNFVAENTYNNNSGGGIYSGYCKDNIIRNNKCLNSQHGIRIDGAFTIVIGNTCSNFNKIGISSGSLSDRSSQNNIIANNQCINCDYGISVTGDNLLIIGNTSVRGTGQVSDYTSSQQTMQIYSSFCLVANNMILGKNYISGVGSNTFVNNKYN